MILPSSLKLFALCILLAVPLLSAQGSAIQKDLYIDPTSTTSSTGDIASPFTSLSAAFVAAQDFINQNPVTQPLAISIYLKEDTTLSNLEGALSLSLDGTQRTPSSIRLASYGSPAGSQRHATIQLTNANTHIDMRVPKVKVLIENLTFKVNIDTSFGQPQIIFIDGEASEVTFSHCAFQDSKVLGQLADNNAIMRLGAGRYLFKNCEFSQLELNIPLIEHQGSQNSLVKYELNNFHDITIKERSLIRISKATAFDFLSSKIEKTSGRLISVTETSSTIISENTFTDTVGQYPIYLNNIQKVIAGKNSITYAPSEHANHQGFLSLVNFNVLGISETTVTGYFGLNSAISIASESTYQAPLTPVVILNGLTLNKNGLCVHDDQKNSGLALINMDLKQKAMISIENSHFNENTYYDMREHPVGRAQGASTFWIQAASSSLKVRKTTLENNKADRSLSNLYASVNDLNVANSAFKFNTKLEGAEASKNTDSSVTFSNFGWFGGDLVFTEDRFEGNYNDYGGAISIRDTEGRIPQFLTVENCTFVNNKAIEGGAIYSDVAPQALQSFIFENNTFAGNEAEVAPDVSSSLGKVTSQTKPRLFLEVFAQSEKRTYVTGELKLEDVISGQDTGYSMEFYISDHKNTRMETAKKYYSSISVASTRDGEAYLVKNFTNELTGPSVMLSSFSLVAPLDSINVVKVTMTNKDDPTEQYTFEFQVRMRLTINEPKQPKECKRGEVYVEKEQACIRCPPGTYSLTPKVDTCQICARGADCSQGGDQIKVLPGFWRDVADSDGFYVYPCTDKEKCLGGTENQCAEGYAGPLCEACNTRDTDQGIYRPFLRNTCKSCNSKDLWEVAGDIVGLAAPIVILLYTFYTILGRKSAGDASQKFSWCLYTNILISYMQNLFILGVLDYVPLPYMFNYIINVVANPSFPIFGYLTCYFPSLITSSRAYLGIFSLFASIPLMKILLVVLMAKLVARRGNALKSSMLGLIWLGFLEAPGILDFCLRFFDCKQVGNWVYSPFFLDLECDASNFELLKTIVLVPAVLIITVVCPLAVTYSLSRGSLRSDEVESQKSLRVMMLAKSADNIDKSHRSWLFFYIATFGRLGLLLLSSSESTSLVSFSVVMLYYSAMALFNMPRKVLSFVGWRTNLLFVDVGMLLISSLLGYGLGFVDGSIKTWLLTALWIGNAGYLLSVNLLTSSSAQGESYGKLKEEGLPSSEEESGNAGEQLDQTM